MSTQHTVSFLSEVLLYIRADNTDAPPFSRENCLDAGEYKFIGVSCQDGQILTKDWVKDKEMKVWSFYDEEARPTWVLGTQAEYAAFCETEARSWA